MPTSNAAPAAPAAPAQGALDDLTAPPPRLVIFDAYALIFRAYFAMQRANLRTAAGEPTGAVRGFTSTLLHIINTLNPTHAAFAFDVADETVFRRDLYPAYKAHREPIPDDLPSQIQRCREIAAAFSIPVYEAPTFEADDVLATLADQAAAHGLDTWICTLDSDLLQLVRDGVSVYMYNPYKSEYVPYDSPAKVRAKYDVDPAQIIDYKALVGDSSDNIPGVKGVGAKGAAKLLNQWRTVEEIYEHLDDITPNRTKNALASGRDDAHLSKTLATIRHDAPVTLDLAAADVTQFDRDAVRAKFSELEFRTLQEHIPGEPPPELEAPTLDYDLVTTESQLTDWLARCQQAPLLAVDLETSSTNTIDCAIAGYALAVAPEEACYIPVGHLESNGEGEQLDADLVREALRPVLEDATIPKVLHNAKFDLKVLRRHGLHLRGLAHDTMLAAFVLNEAQIGLKRAAAALLGVAMTPIEDLIGKGKKQISMLDVPAAQAGPYAAADADMTLRLADVLLPKLADEPVLERLYRELELPLIPILAEMELAGVTLDAAAFADLDATLNHDLAAMTRTVYEDAGREFNLASPKQLSTILFDELKLPPTRKTSQGYSTQQDHLERIADAHPIINHVLQWRELAKLRSTYVEALPQEIQPATGRIHTDYNQTVAATGRLSSEHPNLQNIPVRTAQGRQIRAAFVPQAWGGLPEDADVCFLAADYSQIELRVLAHLSEDDGLITAFRNGEDIHAATASGAYGVALADVQPDMRRVAKMMNFGVIYGLSAHGLSQRSGMPRSDAQAFIDAYFGRFPRVQAWIEETKASTRERGYAETLLGRRRYLPDITARSFQQRNAAERMAVNMPVQGTAADVMKRAMIDIDRALHHSELRARMLLQVHDELIFETPAEEAPALAALLHDLMPQALDLIVPLNIEVKQGPNWRDLEPYRTPYPAN